MALRVKISADYSNRPYNRIMGAIFRDSILIKKYEEAERNNGILEIDFDDCYGFGTSFLEEAFGGMVRKYHKHGMLKRLKFISMEDETIPNNVKNYITVAESEVLR